MSEYRPFIKSTAIDYDMEEEDVYLINKHARDSAEFYRQLEAFIKNRAENKHNTGE